MKTTIIRSSWMPGYGYRMDCQPYLGGALETKLLLEQLPVRKDRLVEVAAGGMEGIYYAGRDTIRWVSSKELGIPCLGSTDIIKSDLSGLSFISKEQVGKNSSFLVRKGWTLITRSGTIGRIAYVRREIDGMACQDVLRVVPNAQKIDSGYLFAFLSCKFGVPLVVSGTYGAIIQHLEPEHLTDLPVPRIGDALEHEIHTLVEKAAELRTQAAENLQAAQREILDGLGCPPQLNTSRAGALWTVAKSAEINQVRRCDAWFFNKRAMTVEGWAKSHANGYWELKDVADVFGVTPFKRVYVADAEHGIGFFGSGDIFKLDRTPSSFISKVATKSIKEYILPRGAILLASSGQLNGIIGRPQFVDSALAGMAASNHVLRIVPKPDKMLAGYLFAYLASKEIGYPLTTRTATGDAIPEIWSVYLNLMPVVRAPKKLMETIDAQVIKAFEMRVQATKIENEARQKVEASIEKR